jgi:hypothetical protein
MSDAGDPEVDAVAARIAGMRGVFVVGVARSGTSLLKALLDGHPEMWVPPAESFAIDWCEAVDPAAAFLALPRYDALLPAGSAERGLVEETLRLRFQPGTGPARAVLAFLEAMARVQSPASAATHWVEKTPKHLRMVPALLSALGTGTRVVCVVRDPRAVLASQARRWERGRTPQGMRHFARRWATGDVLTRAFQEQHPEFLAVRYEDLVATPEDVMRRLAGHLQVTWDDILVKPTRGGEPWGGNSSYGTESAPSRISPVSLRRYEQELPAAIVEGLSRLLAPRMEHWGYEPECGAAGPSRWWLELSTAQAVRRARSSWSG